MQATDLIEQAKALPFDEKLRIVEALWDAIAEDNAALPLNDWQQAELDRRERLYRDGREQLVDATQLHARLRRGS